MLHLTSIQSENEGVHLQTPFYRSTGKVTGVRGPIVIARVPSVALGDICIISGRDREIPAQVVSFDEDAISLAPFDSIEGVTPGARVTSTGAPLMVRLPALSSSEAEHGGDPLLGSVLDALGNRILDSEPRVGPPDPSRDLHSRYGDDELSEISVSVVAPPPSPLARREIRDRLTTGVRAIDTLCPLGYGQRIGLFAGAGVGKSTLLSMIAKNADVDLSVIALVGERGREVKDFINEALGEEGRKRAILVVATSDEPALRRMNAALTATAIAEHYRRLGKRVLLLVDSLTRCARAIREVGLAAGELPVRQGYTSSVYSELPRLLERAGTDRVGSITAIYTVLTNGDGEIDPLGEEAKSILDGHIVLSNRVVAQGIRPAIDITQSVSRLVFQLCSHEEQHAMATVVRILAKLKSDRDILLLGGTPDKELTAALALEPRLRALLSQRPHEHSPPATATRELATIAEEFLRQTS